MCFIGDLERGSSIETKINFLKTCVMLQTLNGRIITSASLLATIELLNIQRDGALGKRAFVRSFTAEDPEKKDANIQIYCQSEVLSLKRPGTVFRAIDLKTVTLDKQQTPEELEEIVETAAAFMDLDVEPSEPAMKRARNELRESKAFKESRVVLASKV